MWDNKSIKKKSKKIMKANYWTLVALCFVLMFSGVIPGNGTDILSSRNYNTEVVETVSREELQKAPELGIVNYMNAFIKGSDQTKSIANNVLSNFKGTGGAAYWVIRTVETFIMGNTWAARLVVILGFLVVLFYLVFVVNLLDVGYMRVLEETRLYNKTGFLRVFTMFKSKGIKNMILIMLWMNILLAGLLVLAFSLPAAAFFLVVEEKISGVWLIPGLIAGGALIVVYIRQYYTWCVLPFILAIDPTISRKEAVALSKSMMEGNRMHALGLDLSFAGWFLLSILTLGLLDIFFLRPYIWQTRCECFMTLREQALAKGDPLSCHLADEALDAAPAAYVAALERDEKSGTWPVAYPYEKIKKGKENWISAYVMDLNPKRQYSLENIILFFFSFAFIGWLWEVTLYLFKQGQFINRGMLYGPWLPIYGFGGVFIIVLLKRFADHPAKLAAVAFVLCGVLEYFTSYFSELVFHKRWWDYSTYFLNINGRICFEGLFFFVLMGLAAVYLVGPLLDNLYNRIPKKNKWAIAGVLLIFFVIDVIYTNIYAPNAGSGVTENFSMMREKIQIEAKVQESGLNPEGEIQI